METVVRTITFTMTQDDINLKAKRLAEAVAERNAINAEKKSVMSGYKAQLEQKDKLIQELSHQISTGEATEDVRCIVRKNYERGIKEYIYEGEVVESVPLTDEDRQMAITD